jgi:excisionase family DNA binding protein
MKERKKMRYDMPIWEKSNLTIDEAAAYTGIGTKKLREISEDEDCEFVLWIGARRLLKRKKLDEYIDGQYSI